MGQDAPPEDFNLVNDLVVPLQAMLRSRDIYDWIDEEVIPDDAFLHLAHVLAAYSASSFGQHEDNRLMELGMVGERELQVIQSKRPDYNQLVIQAY